MGKLNLNHRHEQDIPVIILVEKSKKLSVGITRAIRRVLSLKLILFSFRHASCTSGLPFVE